MQEALLFSASLRLQGKPSKETVADFVEEIMGIVELTSLRSALVGVPGEDNLDRVSGKRNQGVIIS